MEIEASRIGNVDSKDKKEKERKKKSKEFSVLFCSVLFILILLTNNNKCNNIILENSSLK